MELKESSTLGIATVLKELEDTVSSGSRVPLTNKVMVNEEAVQSCIDKVYTALPEEIKKAQKILEQSDKLLESVEDQGQRIIADAKEKALAMTEETAVYQQAVARSQEMMDQAEQSSIQMRHDSLHYCDDVMAQLENALEKMLASIKKNREDLHQFNFYDYEAPAGAGKAE